jgi:hypothetical protein
VKRILTTIGAAFGLSAAVLVAAPAQAEVPRAAPVTVAESSFNFATGIVTTVHTKAVTINRSMAMRACPEIRSKYVTMTSPTGEWGQIIHSYLYCGPHVRPVATKWTGTSGVKGWSGSSSWGRPSTYIHSGSSSGPIVARYEPTFIWREVRVEWPNPYCANPCWTEQDGTLLTWSNVYGPTFRLWLVLN